MGEVDNEGEGNIPKSPLVDHPEYRPISRRGVWGLRASYPMHILAFIHLYIGRPSISSSVHNLESYMIEDRAMAVEQSIDNQEILTA